MLDLQAVIGAGAAGLVTARELQREGHSVQVSLRPSEVLNICFPFCEGPLSEICCTRRRYMRVLPVWEASGTTRRR